MASAPKQPGFLTKMVGLIRASAKEPEAHDGDSVLSRHAVEHAQEKEAIREHIERRRRDDQIRRREFNYLRKLRAEGFTAFPSTAARPSVFQNSSMFNPDASERSRTVGKIDAIEAQMSSQWAASRAPFPQPPAPPTGTRAMALQPVRAAAPSAPPEAPPPQDMEFELDLDFTGLLADPGDATTRAPLTPTPTATQDTVAAVVAPEVTQNTATEAANVDPMRTEHPALCKAATCFAEGDDEAAEAALLAVLQSPESGDVAAEACAAGLLDLYRATGQQSDFDTVAIEYAQLFGRSAPEWFAVDAVVPTRASAPNDATLLAAAASAPTGWSAPARLTLQALAALQDIAGPADVMPMHWDALEEVAPECLAPLRALLGAWTDQPLALQFSGADQLLRVLVQATPLQDRSIEPDWWHLRLEVLRILDQAAAFEDAAMDFCVTYEVSPPSWTPPRCRLVGAVATAQNAAQSAPAEQLPPTALALRGTLQGDVSLALAQLMKQAPPEGPITVSCARLVRVDLAAATSMLHWITELVAQQRSVQLVNVPRLLAAYFEVVGIAALVSVLSGRR